MLQVDIIYSILYYIYYILYYIYIKLKPNPRGVFNVSGMSLKLYEYGVTESHDFEV